MLTKKSVKNHDLEHSGNNSFLKTKSGKVFRFSKNGQK
jgi:hypothetical protein